MAHQTDPQSVLASSLQVVDAGCNVEEPLDDSISATAEATIYRSLPLVEPKSTRVLRILPPELQDGENITCQLEVISLDSDPPPEYYAVSYVWGSPSETRQITVNKVPFVVRENLWAFLDNTRKRDFRGLLWTDAICINQTSIPERNHQVSMMGDIYRSATRVLVWLGLESAIVPPISDELKGPSVEMRNLEKYSQEGLLDSIRLMIFDFLEHEGLITETFKESFVQTKEEETDDEVTDEEESDEEETEEEETEEEETEEEETEEEWSQTIEPQKYAMLSLLAKQMEQLFLIGYWKRMWVVQEYFLAREVTLETDRSQMDGVELKAYLELINVAIAIDHSLCNKFTDFPITTQMLAPSLSGISLGELIEKFADWGCTDPRDHVYALLSLVNPEDLGYGELAPDYSSSELELYIKLSHALVRRLELARRRGTLILHENAHTFAYVLGIDPELGRSVYREVKRLITRDKESGRRSSAKEVVDEIIREGVQPPSPPSPTTEWLKYNKAMSELDKHYAADAVDLREPDEDDVWYQSSSDDDGYMENRRRRRRERAEKKRQEKIEWEEKLKPKWEEAKLQWERRSPVDSDESS
jgi:hypothetical protein